MENLNKLSYWKKNSRISSALFFLLGFIYADIVVVVAALVISIIIIVLFESDYDSLEEVFLFNSIVVVLFGLTGYFWPGLIIPALYILYKMLRYNNYTAISDNSLLSPNIVIGIIFIVFYEVIKFYSN